MQDFYRKIHAIVGELMYADNIYIALYDEERKAINWPFYVDEIDEDWPDPHAWEPIGTGQARGTTAYLLNKGRPLLLTAADWRRLIARGEIDLIGEEAVSWLGVPLQSEGTTIGALVVQSYREDRAHTEGDLELLTFVGRHIAAALERTRLIDETRQRNAELSLINDVQRGLAMNLDMQAMYDLVGDRLQEIFDAQVVDIGVLDEATGLIHFPYTIEKGVRFEDEPMAVIGFRKRVLGTREPLLFHTVTPEILEQYDQPKVIQGEPAKSGVFVPLVVGGRATGVISLQNVDREHAFDDADLRLLTTLAGSLSVALENARLFEETRQRNAELALINDVQRGLAENLEMQTMYDLVGDRLQEIFDAQVVDIGVLDEIAGLIRFPYSIERGVRFPDEPIEVIGFRRHVLETREPYLADENLDEQSERFGQPRVLQGEPPKSSLFVPLVVGGKATGVISLQNLDREHAFSDADVRLLTTLAGSLSVALENARLFEETRQRNAELALINDVQRGLAENLEMQAMYDLVGDRIQDIFDAQVVNIEILDAATKRIHFAYEIERGVRFHTDPIELLGFRRVALETREPVIVNDDIERRSAEVSHPAVIAGEPVQSLVFVPLLVNERAIGLISLQNIDREHAFSEADVRLLTTLAGGLSVALENARLFEETRQRNAELALINDVQRGLAENLEMQAMYDLVGDRIQEIFDAQVVDIGLLDREDGMMHSAYSLERSVRLADEPWELMGVSKHVIERRETVVINERMAERLEELGGYVLQGDMTKSAVYVPLIVGGDATGRISLQNIDREHAFSEADVRLLTTLAGSLSVALENARLFEETRQRNAELALINDVQRGLAENLEMQRCTTSSATDSRRSSTRRSSTSACSTGSPEAHPLPLLDRARQALPGESIEPLGYREPRPPDARADPRRRCTSATTSAASRRASGRGRQVCVFVPLVVGGKATGVISLQNLDREHAFSEADVRLLTTIAGNLSVALENARLFEETRQRNAELALINDVQRSLAENLEMHAMYELVGDRLQEIFDAQVVDIGVLDQESGKLRFPYSIERGIRYPDEDRTSSAAWAATSCRRGSRS